MRARISARRFLTAIAIVFAIGILFEIASRSKVEASGFPLPNFELPYYANTGPYWSGGPHQWNKGQSDKWMDLYAGSGLDFAYGGQSFTVAAMAEGDVIWASETSLSNNLGIQVAVKHTIGGSVIRYGHLSRIWQPILDALKANYAYHVLPGYTIGYAGNSATTNVHLHIELRDGSRDCCGSRGDGGDPISWHGVVVNGYRVYNYRPNELGINPDPPYNEVAYNYDGVAVRISTLPSELGPIEYSHLSYKDDLGDDANGNPIRPINAHVWTFLPNNFVCADNQTTDCESNVDPNVQFAGHGRFGGGGILQSDLSVPTNQPQPVVTAKPMPLARTIPNVPSNLTQTGATKSTVTISWQDNSNNESGFNIYMWTTTDWIRIGSVGANVTSYTATERPPCLNSTAFRVVAYNSVGESTESNVVVTNTACN
jgi:hypothetical protein